MPHNPNIKSTASRVSSGDHSLSIDKAVTDLMYSLRNFDSFSVALGAQLSNIGASKEVQKVSVAYDPANPTSDGVEKKRQPSGCLNVVTVLERLPSAIHAANTHLINSVSNTFKRLGVDVHPTVVEGKWPGTTESESPKSINHSIEIQEELSLFTDTLNILNDYCCAVGSSCLDKNTVDLIRELTDGTDCVEDASPTKIMQSDSQCIPNVTLVQLLNRVPSVLNHASTVIESRIKELSTSLGVDTSIGEDSGEA